MIDNAGLNYFVTPLMFINFYWVKQLNYKTLIKTILKGNMVHGDVYELFTRN